MDTKINLDSTGSVNDTLTKTLANADTAVQTGLNNVTLVHKARLSQQQRYAATLEKEFGPDDAGVKAAQAKVAVTRTSIAQVTAAQQQTSTPTPALSADQWALQGRVYDSDGQPISKLTVFLVDGSKVWLRQFGFSYTDQTGYFLLMGSSLTDATVQLYIEIANDAGLPIYLDSSVSSPVNGQAIYRNITLSSQSEIGDPTPPIREVAIPSASAAPSSENNNPGSAPAASQS